MTRTRVKPSAGSAVTAAAVSRDTEAAIAVLDARTRGVETAVNKLETDVSKLESTLLASIQGLRDDVAKRDRMPWPALGVVLAGVIALGGLAYMPIKTEMAGLAGAMDRTTIQTDRRLEKVWEVTVPRTELDFRLRLFDQRFSDVQRQLDDIKRVMDYRQRRDSRKAE